VSSDSKYINGREVTHLDLFGGINYASLSTIDLSIASIIKMTSEGERDRLHPVIDSSSGDSEQKEKKRVREQGAHSCISKWRVTMTDGASGGVYNVCSIYLYCRYALLR